MKDLQVLEGVLTEKLQGIDQKVEGVDQSLKDVSAILRAILLEAQKLNEKFDRLMALVPGS